MEGLRERRNPASFHRRLTRGFSVVAEKDGHTVGFAQLFPSDVVEMMYCDPGHAHGGIGSQLLAALEQRARSSGQIVLDTKKILPFDPCLVWLRTGVDACLAQCRSRDFEPHKFANPAEQNAALTALLEWVAEYPDRDGPMSEAAHRALFETYQGQKQEVLPEENPSASFSPTQQKSSRLRIHPETGQAPLSCQSGTRAEQ